MTFGSEKIENIKTFSYFFEQQIKKICRNVPPQ